MGTASSDLPDANKLGAPTIFEAARLAGRLGVGGKGTRSAKADLARTASQIVLCVVPKRSAPPDGLDEKRAR
jgi:hypothetical protein